MNHIKLNITHLIRINNSVKDFVLYNLDNNNQVIAIKLTDVFTTI